MKYKNLFSGIIILFLTISLTINVFPSSFHTYHTSLTRMDYNAEDKLIEITIQLFTHDLLRVLERQAKQSSVDIEKTPGIDKILLDYLKENFILKGEKETVYELNWVGKEIKVNQVYLYFEISFEGNSEHLQLNNSIFFESFPQQTNWVIFRFNEEKADLLYKVGDKFKELKPEKDNKR